MINLKKKNRYYVKIINLGICMEKVLGIPRLLLLFHSLMVTCILQPVMLIFTYTQQTENKVLESTRKKIAGA